MCCCPPSPPELLRILIVDDTPENLRVLGQMLDEAGYEVMIATNGQDALANTHATPSPDLILLDIMTVSYTHLTLPTKA